MFFNLMFLFAFYLFVATKKSLDVGLNLSQLQVNRRTSSLVRNWKDNWKDLNFNSKFEMFYKNQCFFSLNKN